MQLQRWPLQVTSSASCGEFLQARTLASMHLPTLQMYMIVPLAIYLLERLVRLVLPHVRNTELVDVKLMGGNEKVCGVAIWAQASAMLRLRLWQHLMLDMLVLPTCLQRCLSAGPPT